MTPTQTLILDLLAARYRTGESYWTISTRHGAALRGLQDRGLVTLEAADTPRPALRVTLTAAGREEALWDGWEEPYAKARREIALELEDQLALEWWAAMARSLGLDPDQVIALAQMAAATIHEHGRLGDLPATPENP